MHPQESKVDFNPSAHAGQGRGAGAPRQRPGKRDGVVLIVALSVALCGLPRAVRAQFDDFNDGNDQGWTHVSPLVGFGVPGVFTVTNGAYRIQTTKPSPSPALLGPPRAYSLRRDMVYTDFYVSVDLVDWNDTALEGFGLAARVRTPGLGSSAGYAFTYTRSSSNSAGMQISRVTGERPTPISSGAGDIRLDPAKDYRLVFVGTGSHLEGRVYELPNAATPVLAISGDDTTYTNGISGLVVFDNSGGGGVTDATFDNYLAACTEPPQLACPTVDQHQSLTDTTASVAIGGGSEQKLAQIVTVGLSGPLTEIQLPLFGCDSGDLAVEIQGVANNRPNGVVLASKTVSGSSLPAGAPDFRSVAFSAPVFLTACSQFAIVLRSAGSCGLAPGSAGDTYAGGDAFFDARPNPPGWVALGRDLAFRTIVGQPNPPPVVSLTGPASGSVYAVNTPVSFTATFTDANGGTHTGAWTFGNAAEPAAIVEPIGANPGLATATHTFTAPGIYKVALTVTDDCGDSASANQIAGLEAVVVIYDAAAGFVTGGGWIDSPPGAYASNPRLTGKASFGFVCKYLRGSTVPAGETEFQFRPAGVNFHSSSCEWLVVSGAMAQYQATGQINGAGNYGLLLTATDGQVTGGGADNLRVKIWNIADGGIVYDNVPGASRDLADGDTEEIERGSIVLHK
jgi:hypothetical protein